jgi:HEAT repeat protein
MRLEDQRILRDPNPPAPVVLVPAATGRPAIVAPPPPSNLIRLVNDDEARTRRRAALALGRVGLPEAVPALQQVLGDPDVEVRQMAAFALGLIGDASARPALLNALRDGDPIVQGRSAEALGTIGDKSDAAAIATMVKAHVQSGALMNIAPDDLAWPLAPPVESARLGLYALVRLGSFDAIAAAVLDASGAPVSTWWPLAYALGRAGDARAAPALVSLLATPGRLTAAFAARGLGTLRAQNASTALRDIVMRRQRDAAVVIQAVRALAAIRDTSSVPLLEKILAEGEVDPTLRLEAATAMGAIHSPEMLDFVDRSDVRRLAWNPSAQLRARIDRCRNVPDDIVRPRSGSGLDSPCRAGGGACDAARRAGRSTIDLHAGGPRSTSHRAAPPRAGGHKDAGRSANPARSPEDGRFCDQGDRSQQPCRDQGDRGRPCARRRVRCNGRRQHIRGASRDSYRLNTLDSAAARPLLQAALKDRDWAVRVKAATPCGISDRHGHDHAAGPERRWTTRSGRRRWHRRSRRTPSSKRTGAPSRSSSPSSTRH